MAESEKSFQDRWARGTSLKNACDEFDPDFAPADPKLGVTLFMIFLDAIEAANGQVSTMDATYSAEASDRVALVKTIKARTTESLSYVESNVTWKTLFPKVKMVADKLRGVRPHTPKPLPNPPPGQPPAKKPRNKGDQSYEDIAGHLEKLIAVLGKVPGYAPSVLLTINSFSSHLSGLRSMNRALSTREQEVSLAKGARSALYYGDEALQGKMRLIKKAVRSQYGSASTQFAAVKGINF